MMGTLFRLEQISPNPAHNGTPLLHISVATSKNAELPLVYWKRLLAHFGHASTIYNEFSRLPAVDAYFRRGDILTFTVNWKILLECRNNGGRQEKCLVLRLLHVELRKSRDRRCRPPKWSC